MKNNLKMRLKTLKPMIETNAQPNKYVLEVAKSRDHGALIYCIGKYRSHLIRFVQHREINQHFSVIDLVWSSFSSRQFTYVSDYGYFPAFVFPGSVFFRLCEGIWYVDRLFQSWIHLGLALGISLASVFPGSAYFQFPIAGNGSGWSRSLIVMLPAMQISATSNIVLVHTGWRKKTGPPAILSHCKYSENSMTELHENWWTSAILYAEHSH